VQLGNEDPIASMDAGGKVVLARHNEISTVDIKKLDADATPADGERLVLAAKELDVCEIYPQSLIHNSNGRFAVVTGDGEYIIYTALAWRKKSFGNALDFVWALDSGEYAVRSAPPVHRPSTRPPPSPARPPRPPPAAPDAHPPLPPPGAREPDVDQALPQL
jgi:coatomer subunit beta'